MVEKIFKLFLSYHKMYLAGLSLKINLLLYCDSSKGESFETTIIFLHTNTIAMQFKCNYDLASCPVFYYFLD